MGLNKFQSDVVNAFNRSNNNLLLVAPTGSGKTYIAEYIAKSVQGRVLYVEPLKAIVYQVIDDFHNKFNGYNNVIPLLTEVYEDDPEDIQEKIVVSSYEKADSLTRRYYKFMDEVRLLVIDEVHNVSDKERGKSIQSLVVWAKDNGIRIVSMSATVPFLHELVKWLDADLVRSDDRPIPLYKYVRVGKTLYDGREKIELSYDLLDHMVKKKKVVMVFSSTKKKVEALYELYRKRYPNLVTFLHSGLHPDDRNARLHDILQGKYRIVFSTTLLGQGVNLPFYAVVFDDVRLPVIESGRFVGWKFINSMEFDQICGRAGRPGFDDEGLCIVDAQDMREAQKFIKRYVEGQDPELVLEYDIRELVLTVITRKMFTDFDTVLRNVRYSLSFQDATERDVRYALDVLKDYDMIGENDLGFYVTPYGRAVATSYIDIETAGHFVEGIELGKPFKEIIYNSPKVLASAKGEDASWVINAWISGIDEKEILNHTDKLGYSDLTRLVGTVAWQSFALYRVLRSLGKDEDAKKVLSFHLSVAKGVPLDVVSLVSIPGIGRKKAMELRAKGVTSRAEICEKRDASKPILGEKMVNYLCQ